MQLGITFDFEKADATGRYVRGWASVVHKDGAPVEDSEGDVIEIDELRKAAHAFITDARVAKLKHSGDAIGEVVESVIVDDAFAKNFGITDSRRGWWIGMAINDPDIQARVRKGEFRAFSIGGTGKREAM
ncbi:Phage-like element PBSX protein, XkdF [uncultured Caudovirales phage]|uniref:Phage-like element PBSX protein, XkdF n=1 Tax=uncultured Caudovirales phage TaxID=2100421 RepID=A0A6J5QE52_9CAUD|nr:Phage-like element PBSX protein, XkdF [uncultured Caudovirales phage]